MFERISQWLLPLKYLPQNNNAQLCAVIFWSNFMKSRKDLNCGKDDREYIEESTSVRKTVITERTQPILVNISDIVLGNCGREVDDRKVRQLERSIADQGLRNPIQVYELSNDQQGKFGLAAGQHRLKAVKNLCWQKVSAVIIPRNEAKAWRASENLHRLELDELQKSLEIVEYATHRVELPGVNGKAPKGGI
jgi:hypothetical protein